MLFIWGVILVLGGFLYIISLVIKMPYDNWLSKNIPAWLSVLNCILLGACLAIMAIPDRSAVANNFVWSLGLLSGIITKSTFTKALGVNIIVIIISSLVYIALKHHYRQREGQKKGTG
jgi:hypothetical protein